LTIRTEAGVELVAENDVLPLYVSVLVYYDYTRGCIRDVVENKVHPDTEDLDKLREVEEDEIETEDHNPADGLSLLNTFYNDLDNDCCIVDVDE